MIDYGCSDSPDACIAIYAGREIERVEHTVASLLNKTAYSNWTIRVGVDRALAPQLEKYRSDQLTIDPLDKDTGRCAYFDSLARTIDTDYLVFMDPGVIVLQANWLERLLAQGQRPEVGVARRDSDRYRLVWCRWLYRGRRHARAGRLYAALPGRTEPVGCQQRMYADQAFTVPVIAGV
jgi:hypothetical protein